MIRRLISGGLMLAFALTLGCGSSVEGNGGNGKQPDGGAAPAPKKQPKVAAANA